MSRRWARSSRRAAHARRGAVLLEVVLAMVIFAGASAVLLSGLSAANAAAQRVERRGTGADLAVTVMSEVQIGLIDRTDAGPEHFEEGLGPIDWTWQLSIAPAGDENTTGLDRVRVVVRDGSGRIAGRLTRWLEQIGAEGGGL